MHEAWLPDVPHRPDALPPVLHQPILIPQTSAPGAAAFIATAYPICHGGQSHLAIPESHWICKGKINVIPSRLDQLRPCPQCGSVPLATINCVRAIRPRTKTNLPEQTTTSSPQRLARHALLVPRREASRTHLPRASQPGSQVLRISSTSDLHVRITQEGRIFNAHRQPTRQRHPTVHLSTGTQVKHT